MTDKPISDTPPKPAKLKARYEIDGERMRIEFRRVQWVVGLFLGVWLTGWTVGCVALAIAIVNQPHVGMLLFALPFWSSWFLVAAILMLTVEPSLRWPRMTPCVASRNSLPAGIR